MRTINNNHKDFLPFTNDFIFGMVMREPNVCLGFLKAVLPEEDFSEIKMKLPANPLLREDPLEEEDFDLEKVKVEIQKSLKFEGGMHGVRFDAYAETSEKCAEIEMQTVKEAFIGKRTRFYQCNMDLDHFEQGKAYSQLKRSFIIMVCTYDPFKLDEPVYIFQSFDENLGLKLDDEAYKIVLNTACTPKKVPKELSALYAYINDPSKSESSTLVKAIDEFLDSLSPQKRSMFVCRYWYNDSISEIAKQFHVKENAVSMTLRRIRAKLQKYLVERGYDV